MIDLSESQLVQYDSLLNLIVLRDLPLKTYSSLTYYIKMDNPRLRRLNRLYIKLKPFKNKYIFNYGKRFNVIHENNKENLIALDKDSLITIFKIEGVYQSLDKLLSRSKLKGFSRVIDDNEYFSAIPLINELWHWDNGVITASNSQIIPRIEESDFKLIEEIEEENKKSCPIMKPFYYAQTYSEQGYFVDTRTFLVDARWLDNPRTITENFNGQYDYNQTLTDNEFNLLIGSPETTGEQERYIKLMYKYIKGVDKHPTEKDGFADDKLLVIDFSEGKDLLGLVTKEMIDCFQLEFHADNFNEKEFQYFTSKLLNDGETVSGIILYEPFSMTSDKKVTVKTNKPKDIFGISLELKHYNLYNGEQVLKMVDRKGHDCL